MLTSLYPTRRVVDELERDFDRFFEGFLGGRGIWQSLGPRAFPALNVWETEDGYGAAAELPGLGIDDVELSVLGKRLVIEGQRASAVPENATYQRRERPAGSFRREIELPDEIDAERVEASLENGVLTVRLPKAPTARARHIPVKALNGK